MNETLKRIKEASSTERKTVHVEAWDVDLLLVEPVRSVLTNLKDQYLKMESLDLKGVKGVDDIDPEDVDKLVATSDMDSFSHALLVAIVHDVDGKPVFESIEEVREVMDSNSIKVYHFLVEECTKLVNLPTEKEMEEIEGNSQAIPS